VHDGPTYVYYASNKYKVVLVVGPQPYSCGGCLVCQTASATNGGMWIVGEWLWCHGHMHEAYPHLAALCWLIMRIILILLLYALC